jgi:two-component system KDP operon response regulator KdpE
LAGTIRWPTEVAGVTDGRRLGNQLGQPLIPFRLTSARNGGDLEASRETARRALVLHDRAVVVDLIQLTLNHGMFVVRAASNLTEAEAILAEWRPHLAVIDMDHEDSTALMQRLGTPGIASRTETPVLGLTQWGDLGSKLKAFDLGVDDIMTMPFSPDELLARAIVMTRRATGRRSPDRAVDQLGEIEVDIVNRQVRAGTHVIHLSGIEQSLLYLLASRGGALSLGKTSSTRSGGPTSSPKAMSSTVTSAVSASSCRTTTDGRASSRRSLATGIASSQRSRTRAGRAPTIQSASDPRPTPSHGRGTSALSA